MNIIFICFTFFTISLALTCDPNDYSNTVRQIFNFQNKYDVVEGTYTFLDTASGSGANVNGVYGVFRFSDESVDTGENGVTNYLLRAQSAYIFAGCTSPKSRYTSIASYVYQRYNDDITNEDTFIYRASLGAALNNLVWKTSDSPVAPYEALSTVIQTADQQTWTEILEILTNNTIENIPESQINLQSLPRDYIRFLPYEYDLSNADQYTGPYDIGNINNRITITFNKADLVEYMNLNQTVFRLTPKQATGNQPRAPFAPVKRDTFNNQNVDVKATFDNKFENYLEDLIAYYEDEIGYKYIGRSTFEDAYLDGAFGGVKEDYGFTCLVEGDNCLDDVRDAIYWASSFKFFGTFRAKYYLVVGVLNNYININQSSYFNIGLYKNPLTSITPIGSYIDNELSGSGSILPVPTSLTQTDLDKIFVLQTSRQDLFIDELPGFSVSREDLYDFIPFVYIGRDYLNPITKTRPDQSQLIRSVLLEFRDTIF